MSEKKVPIAMPEQQQNKIAAALGPTADCMEIDDLAAILNGRGGEEARLQASTHVANCTYCVTELALLHEFEAPAIQSQEQAAVNAITARLRTTSPAAPLPWWKGLLDQFWTPRILAPVSLGFAALFVAITIGIQSRHSPGQPIILPEHEVTRSQVVSVIGPRGDQAQAPHQLQWQATAGAERYSVKLMEVDRTELWSTSDTHTSVPLPPDIQEKIVPLKTLVWQVTAFDSGGTVLATSGPQQFRLQAR